MSWFESLVLGLVQGLTEFLPISSSAHLRLTAAFAGWEDPGAAFTAVTQIGTETAVLIYFRRDIARILSAWARSLVRPEARREHDAWLGWLVLIGSLPIGVLGLTLKDQIEGPFRDLRLIAVSLIVLGLVLGAADRFAAGQGTAPTPSATRRSRTAPEPRGSGKTVEQLTVRDGLLYGCAQALALIPGVSRSGATISAGLFMGYTREAAARYSFLLAIPAVLASGLFELRHVGEGHVSWGPTVLATLLAFLVGYAVIAWFMRFITTRGFMPFVVYRILLGLVILALVGVGALTPHQGPSVG
ncbi:undecaprenyl-diphosphate phosphatase [Streptomyces sp. AJS327]|uniref:undecaprenyl-diphosphate phosphatase n=1 Tax=Streptomyces sp. AJS327 TaxID=2545265 RepID=UPI0015DF4EA0|nr:undecaprenyl-diphosphate phosphatase [Streptomyces sp. AJS327]MBA0051135.1 undecaprenyl-diphosphate phosphatase [Streptomyces sp. AJS327]